MTRRFDPYEMDSITPPARYRRPRGLLGRLRRLNEEQMILSVVLVLLLVVWLTTQVVGWRTAL